MLSQTEECVEGKRWENHDVTASLRLEPRCLALLISRQDRPNAQTALSYTRHILHQAIHYPYNMAIQPITGRLRKRLWLDLSVALGLGVAAGYTYWSVSLLYQRVRLLIPCRYGFHLKHGIA